MEKKEEDGVTGNGGRICSDMPPKWKWNHKFISSSIILGGAVDTGEERHEEEAPHLEIQ